jgi:site-specific recombinase XerD
MLRIAVQITTTVYNRRMSCTLTQALQDWTADQRKRRRALSPATIASYSDAWHAFMQWAAANDRHTTQALQARDFAAWINTLGHLADGSVQTYSHGTIAICKYLADRGLLGCEISLIQMHIGDALPRIVPSRAPDVADLRRLVSFYDTGLPAGAPHSKPERDRLSALRNNALLHLLFSSACRISEVLAIDLADIRGDHGAVAARVSVVGKGNKRQIGRAHV